MGFTKMHGCGNAYVYVDCRTGTVDDPSGVARRVSDSRTGVGADGLILLFPSARADVRVEMYNADGSRMSMCGNGVRCVGKLAVEGDWDAGRALCASQPVHAPRQELAGEGRGGSAAALSRVMQRTIQALSASGAEELEVRTLTVETDAGVKTLYCYAASGRVDMVTVDMGPASLSLADMNCTLAGGTAIDRQVSVGGRDYRLTCVSTGNLHAVLFVDDVEHMGIETPGRAIEHCPIFPDRVNVHFVQVLSAAHLRMRTWERGSGATRACGTGACAATVAATATRGCTGACMVDQPGGRLHVDAGESVFLTGEVRTVCSGVWHLPASA